MKAGSVKTVGDVVYFAPIPGSCVPGSGMLSGMVVGILAHWATLEEQGTEPEGGRSIREKDLAFERHKQKDREFKVILGHRIMFSAHLGCNSM